MSIQGAGGTEGGIGRFFLGLIMLIGGGYLFLSSVNVTNSFGMGYRLFSVGGMGITSGFVLIPFIFGTGMVFFNSKNYIGWFLMISSIVMLAFGVITSLHFSMRSMSLFELLIILILGVGGLGLFLSSLRSFSK
ncbi:hypothetical protein [Chondrinema litorale]|uniref:hypothetical protein n=1 Tax=Chondrinema litorale TaxID=2994555 RepID=UPI002543939B|nr:hypothetical protein [Chondrinema litorale]UZR92274.1 hypothetical protein OQ292_10395 [Chondrinema litorale]